MELETVTLVVLRRGPRAHEWWGEQLEELQRQHIAHLADLRQSGKLLVTGPFSAQPDETWRGLCLYATDLDETRRLAEADPSVRAGRLAVDVLHWHVPKGELRLGRRTAIEPR